jgi:hypothetical protein
MHLPVSFRLVSCELHPWAPCVVLLNVHFCELRHYAQLRKTFAQSDEELEPQERISVTAAAPAGSYPH